MSEPRIALITGTSKGIGAFLAADFCERGFHVVGCSRSESSFDHERYEHVVADVTDAGDVRSLMTQIRKQHKRLDVLVNNAGAAAMNHALLTPDSTVKKVFDLNFAAVFALCREAARLLRRAEHGRIVNMSTVAVPLAIEGEAVYAASKAALESLTRVLSRELAPLGITCDVVGPTPIETDLIRGVPKDKIDAIVERLAVKRLGTFEDVANVVRFFVSPESDYVTGQTIYLGGA